MRLCLGLIWLLAKCLSIPNKIATDILSSKKRDLIKPDAVISVLGS